MRSKDGEATLMQPRTHPRQTVHCAVGKAAQREDEAAHCERLGRSLAACERREAVHGQRENHGEIDKREGEHDEAGPIDLAPQRRGRRRGAVLRGRDVPSPGRGASNGRRCGARAHAHARTQRAREGRSGRLEVRAPVGERGPRRSGQWGRRWRRGREIRGPAADASGRGQCANREAAPASRARIFAIEHECRVSAVLEEKPAWYAHRNAEAEDLERPRSHSTSALLWSCLGLLLGAHDENGAVGDELPNSGSEDLGRMKRYA